MQQWVQLLGTTKSTDQNPLELRGIRTGAEPGTFTFEVPISYDALQDKPGLLGTKRLALFSDGNLVSLPKRSSNGNCILIWDAIYDPPGAHRLQAELLIGGTSGTRPLEARGPSLSITSTNAFQLEEFWNAFSTSRGAVLHAILANSNGSYQVQLYDSAGRPVKSFQGTVSNGVLEEHWDLRDSQGALVTDHSINAAFRITLPGRDPQVRTQTLYRASP